MVLFGIDVLFLLFFELELSKLQFLFNDSLLFLPLLMSNLKGFLLLLHRFFKLSDSILISLEVGLLLIFHVETFGIVFLGQVFEFLLQICLAILCLLQLFVLLVEFIGQLILLLLTRDLKIVNLRLLFIISLFELFNLLLLVFYLLLKSRRGLFRLVEEVLLAVSELG